MAPSILSTLLLFLTIITFTSAQLPAYTGPHGVGTFDLEIPLQQPQILFPNITLKSNSQPAFRLDTVRFTLYYPSNSGVNSTKPNHLWYPEPRSLIAQGLSGVSGTDPGLIQLGFNLYARNLTVPAQVDVPLLAGDEKFPVILFSHGQPTVAGWYSQFFGEMASRGVLVVSATHRDGSSPASVVRFANGTSYNLTLFTEDMVTPQISSDSFHAAQLTFRLAEWNEITTLLTSINSGSGSSIANSSSLSEGTTTLSSFTNRLNLNKTIIAGHSFGANTVLHYLSSSVSLPASAGLAFDPGQSSGPLLLPNHTIPSVPLLVVQSEEWSAYPPTPFYSSASHFQAVKSIVSDSLARSRGSWFVTLLGTVHTSITDVGLIAPAFAQFFTNHTELLTLEPKAVVREYVGVASDFVGFVMGRGIGGVLAREVDGEFRRVGNASGVSGGPWEVHVGTGGGKKKVSGGSRFGFDWRFLVVMVAGSFMMTY